MKHCHSCECEKEDHEEHVHTGHVHGDHHDEEHENRGLQAVKLAVSFVFFAAALICEHALKTNLIIYLLLYIAAYAAAGYDVVISAFKGIIHGKALDECFLMAVASAGAFFTGEYAEAAAVMILYSLGELLQDLAVDKSRDSISALIDFVPKTALVLKDGAVAEINAEDVEIGDTVVIRPGSSIPVDGTIIEGSTSVDTSALTGESIPKDLGPGDAVLSGCMNLSGEIRIKAEVEYSNSAAARVKKLIEGSEARRAGTESFISKFARIYTPVVVILALAIAVVVPLFDHNWKMWIHRALTFLVISCPCALVISVPLTFFAGVGAASRKGILVKGAEHLEKLSKAEIFAFDKTGTLTNGVIKVNNLYPASDLKTLTGVICNIEAHSDHPIAKAFADVDYEQEEVTDIKEIPGEGIVCVINGSVCAAGNKKLMKRLGIETFDADGTAVHACRNGVYLGYAEVSDTVKPEAEAAVAGLRSSGIKKTVMLTGDTEASAKRISESVHLTEYRSSLLPEDKVSAVEELKKEGATAYVGDGINDAAVLVSADTGIAMGSLGSDIAIDAADIVITDDDLGKLPKAVKISKKTVRIAWQNIVFALSVKVIILLLSALGIMDMMWLAVFADTGVALLCAANAMRSMI